MLLYVVFMQPSLLLFLSSSDIGTQQEKDSRTAKALEMSLRYGFVTPVTSMVVTKPETEDGADSALVADKLTEGEILFNLEQITFYYDR